MFEKFSNQDFFRLLKSQACIMNKKCVRYMKETEGYRQPKMRNLQCQKKKKKKKKMIQSVVSDKTVPLEIDK